MLRSVECGDACAGALIKRDRREWETATRTIAYNGLDGARSVTDRAKGIRLGSREKSSAFLTDRYLRTLYTVR